MLESRVCLQNKCILTAILGGVSRPSLGQMNSVRTLVAEISKSALDFPLGKDGRHTLVTKGHITT